MDPVTASLMAIGTGSATGLRPYFTVFALSLAGITVPEDAPGFIANTAGQIPESIANPWVLVICAVLALGDGGLDKILGLNLPLETINQVLRPIFGALVGVQLGMDAGVASAVTSGVLGLGTATPVSLGKGSLTAGLTAVFPEPVSQFLRSLIEDFGAFALVILALVLPFLAAFLGVVMVVIGIALFFLFRKALRSMRTKFSQVKQRRAQLKKARAERRASGQQGGALQNLRRLAKGNPMYTEGGTASTLHH